MKYLIAGLGNIGSEYENTRHNIGFLVLDQILKNFNSAGTAKNVPAVSFHSDRYAAIAETRFRGKTLVLIKPSTFMNLSGKAVNYWLQQEKIPIDRLLVITDDLALPLGKLRMRPKGSDGGHNGLSSIIEIIGRDTFARLRLGIGNNFAQGRQIDYVLGNWTKEEIEVLPTQITTAAEAAVSFCTIGPESTMNKFNSK